MRVLVVWCPDWSVVAGLVEAEQPATTPAAVFSANIVQACNGAARAEGVRRGHRRRDAQARCPELALLPANPDRDARAFEPVLATVEHLRPGVAALRPGLLAVRAPGSWFGTETNATATVCQALVDAGTWDVRLGVADDLFTAEQAARAADLQGWEVVPPGGSARFLRGLPVGVLEHAELVSLLRRLGLTTLGDVADLPGDAVLQRLGREGHDVWRRVRGEDPTLFSPRTPPPELDVEVVFEPPLDSAEAVAFSVRTTAERFVAQLAHHQLVATGVRVEVVSTDDVPHDKMSSVRTWLHPRYFGARDLVDRVHWQLQAGTAGSALRARKHTGGVGAPVELVRFVPETVEPASSHGDDLWGGGSDARVERGVARVQGMVGFDAVRRPVLQGGRSPAARQATVAWGERAVDLRPRDRPWPGQVPGPAPVRVFAEPMAAEVVDEVGRAVVVSDRGAVSGHPSRFRLAGSDIVPALPWQPVTAWAGPWPVDEAWWSGGAGLVARFQVVGADGRAWLCVCGPDGWSVEAGYD